MGNSKLKDDMIYAAMLLKGTVEELCDESGIEYVETPHDIGEGNKDISMTVQIGDQFHSKILREDYFEEDLFTFFCFVHQKVVDLLD